MSTTAVKQNDFAAFKTAYDVRASLAANGQLEFNNGKYPHNSFITLSNDLEAIAKRLRLAPYQVLENAGLPDFRVRESENPLLKLAKFELTYLYRQRPVVTREAVKSIKAQFSEGKVRLGLPARLSLEVLRVSSWLGLPVPLQRVPQWVNRL